MQDSPSEPTQVAEATVEVPPKCTKDEEREIMLQWLETDNNYQLVWGNEREKSRGLDAWKSAASFFKKKCRVTLSPTNMKARFRRYREAFFAIEAEQEKGPISEGVQPENGVESQAVALYGYGRMAALCAGSTRSNPSFEVSTGRGQVTFGSKTTKYTVADATVDAGRAHSGISNDCEPVFEGEWDEDEEDEEEEVGEALVDNTSYKGKTYAKHRSKTPAASSVTKSMISKRTRSISPGRNKRPFEDSSPQKSAPIGLHDQQPPQRGALEQLVSMFSQRHTAVDELMTKKFQQLCDDIARLHHCQAILHVSLGATDNSGLGSSLGLAANTPSSLDTRFNVTLSGDYQRVMNARGAILRNSPLKARLSIPVSKSLISSPPDSGNIKEQRRRRTRGQSSSQSNLQAPADTDPESISHTTQDTAPTADVLSTVARNEKADDDTHSLTPAASPAAVDGPSKASTLSAPSPLTSSCAPTFTVLPHFRTSVDHISATTKTTITLLSSRIDATASNQSTKAIFARQDVVELQVTGSWENAEAARVLLLVAIDTLQPGVVSERLQVELKYQNMIGGRKRQDLQDLMARTGTSIYLTSPFVQTANKSGCPVDPRYNDIYITGEPKQVAVAKEALTRAYNRAQASSISCTREVDIATRKLDWMLQHHREKLRSIMLDNASFIAFPPLGGTHPSIFVYGESNVNVERTIRTVMQLSCHFQCGSITRRDSALSMHMPHAVPSIINICKVISQASGAEVEYRNNGFLMFGNEIQTRTAMQFLMEIDLVKTLPFEFKFTVELANEHREFISGKKNGKINRIMKATGARIKFDQCNGYNFYVDLGSTIAAKTMEALALLQEELPAEISFYVPETYHKRIIGVGGKNIQRIMKKYGVYVKFSNSEEFAILGGYFDNQDNVVARTPSKNAVNLENLKQAVMEFVGPKDKDFVRHNLIIPKQDHIALLTRHAESLRQIHEDTNAAVLFPERETGSDIVTVCGPELYIQQATTMLLSMAQERFTFLVPYSKALVEVLDLPEFMSEVVDVIKQAWNITLVTPSTSFYPNDTVTSQSSADSADSSSKLAESSLNPRRADEEAAVAEGDQSAGQGERSNTVSSADASRPTTPLGDLAFVFEYTRNNEDSLQNAKQVFDRFLIRHQIEINEEEIHIPHLRPEPTVDIFLHPRTPSALNIGDLQTPVTTDYALFDTAAGGAFNIATGSRRPGDASPLVTSDIRALFGTGNTSALPSLNTSPSRWSDHSRHSSSFLASPSAAPGSSFGLGSVPSIGQNNGSPSTFTRVASMPSDPWAPAKHHQRHSQVSGNYLGSIGDLRSAPPGMTNASLSSPGSHGSGFYSQSGYTQYPAEGSYNKPPGFQALTSASSGHRYSGSNSPVHGANSTIGNYDGLMGHSQGSPQNASPQRQQSLESPSSRGSMQYLDDKLFSGSTFGPGYGPSLNSGNARPVHQQQMTYQHQQQFQHHQQQSQPFSGQAYSSHLSLQPGVSYPQQRQRHSSQNSAASHHTMGLGPIGSGPGSAGGSVNSDEISTEEDSDEVFDEMRNRQKGHTVGGSSALFKPHPQVQITSGSGYEGYSSHNSSSSSLFNRRGSGGSTHSLQQPYFSGGGIDVYGQNGLVGAMEKHSLNGHHGHHQESGDMNVGGGRSFQGRLAQGRQSTGIANQGAGGGLSGLNAGSRFDDDRGFFTSGFGGIIGDGAHGYGRLGSSSTSGSSSTATQGLGQHQHVPQAYESSFGSGLHGGNSHSNGFDGFGGKIDLSGGDEIIRSESFDKAGLSASSSLAFYMNPPLQHASAGRLNEGSRLAGWDR
ncbi:hypothetical protein BGZ72_000301 [Mortierella alpina]|nr:hypothetical protein BGZ72_000301 [Mortierella alpina]